MNRSPHPPARVLEQLFEVAGLIGDAMQGELGADGLTPARAEVVWRLHHHGSMTQRELSQALGCSPRNVTGLVDGLEATGLVARGPHPSDRRATLVALTDVGAQRAESWQAGYERLAEQLLADLDPGDVRHLVDVLDRILPRLRASLPASTASG